MQDPELVYPAGTTSIVAGYPVAEGQYITYADRTMVLVTYIDSEAVELGNNGNGHIDVRELGHGLEETMGGIVQTLESK